MRENYITAVQAPSVEPVPETVEGMLSNLLNRCSRLSALTVEAENLADRLGGSRPMDTEKGMKPSGVPNGLIEKLQDISSTLLSKIEQLSAAIDRADRALGG